MAKDGTSSTATPRLRFPDFADSWKSLSIGDFFDLTASAEKTATFDGSRVITVRLHANGVVKNERTTLTGGASYFERQAGQFIFSKIDLLNGAFGMVPEALDGFSSSSDVPAYSFNKVHSPTFFLNWLTANYDQLEIERTGTSNTLKRVSPTKFLALLIPAPSRAEQQKIADCLTSLDDVIAAQGRKVAALADHKRGLMQQLFPREGETLPRLRLPEFRDAPQWAERPLSTAIQLISGVHLSPEQYSTGGDLPYFTGPSDFTIDMESVEKWTVASANAAKADDTLITVKGSGVGELWHLAIESVALGRQLMAVRVVEGSARFVYYFLSTKRSRFEDLASGNLIPGLTRGDILDMPAHFPSASEQQRIAACLSALDAQIAAESAKRDLLKAHKQALMQQLFPAAVNAEQLASDQPAPAKNASQASETLSAATAPDEPIYLPARKPYTIGFARQLLAAEILQYCHSHPTTGRVKLQKLIHLCEYHAELDDIHGTYARAAAGPFDNKLMRGVAIGLEKQKWFKPVRGEKRTFYEPMKPDGQHAKYLQRWSAQLPKVHEVIQLFAAAKTLTCEIASTLYAAWNDLLIEGRQPTDAEIIREASDPKRWHESKANIDTSKWPTALKWMRAKGLVPRGYGAHTTKPEP